MGKAAQRKRNWKNEKQDVYKTGLSHGKQGLLSSAFLYRNLSLKNQYELGYKHGSARRKTEMLLLGQAF